MKKKEMPLLLTLWLVGALTTVSGYIPQREGVCPNVTTVANFNMTRFQEPWYVVYAADIPPDCLVVLYDKASTSTVNYWKPYKFKGGMTNWGRVLDGSSIFRYFRFDPIKLEVDQSNPAIMTFVLGAYRKKLYVINTDYVNYAITFECENHETMHRYKASVLWRSLPYNFSIINEIFKQVETYNIKKEDWIWVDHVQCMDDKSYIW